MQAFVMQALVMQAFVISPFAPTSAFPLFQAIENSARCNSPTLVIIMIMATDGKKAALGDGASCGLSGSP